MFLLCYSVLIDLHENAGGGVEGTLDLQSSKAAL